MNDAKEDVLRKRSGLRTALYCQNDRRRTGTRRRRELFQNINFFYSQLPNTKGVGKLIFENLKNVKLSKIYSQNIPLALRMKKIVENEEENEQIITINFSHLNERKKSVLIFEIRHRQRNYGSLRNNFICNYQLIKKQTSFNSMMFKS